jgi:hypothetical protein
MVRHVWMIEASTHLGFKPLGIGCWSWVRPAHLFGYTLAAFETRTAARHALKDIKASWPRARVVKVEVAYRPIAETAGDRRLGRSGIHPERTES